MYKNCGNVYSSEVWLICETCGRIFEVELQTAKELWSLEDQGVPVACGNCDAVAREKDLAALQRVEA